MCVYHTGGTPARGRTDPGVLPGGSPQASYSKPTIHWEEAQKSAHRIELQIGLKYDGPPKKKMNKNMQKNILYSDFWWVDGKPGNQKTGDMRCPS